MTPPPINLLHVKQPKEDLLMFLHFSILSNFLVEKKSISAPRDVIFGNTTTPHSTALKIHIIRFYISRGFISYSIWERKRSNGPVLGRKVINCCEHATNLKTEATQLMNVLDNDASGAL